MVCSIKPVWAQIISMALDTWQIYEMCVPQTPHAASVHCLNDRRKPKWSKKDILIAVTDILCYVMLLYTCP